MSIAGKKSNGGEYVITKVGRNEKVIARTNGSVVLEAVYENDIKVAVKVSMLPIIISHWRENVSDRTQA